MSYSCWPTKDGLFPTTSCCMPLILKQLWKHFYRYSQSWLIRIHLKGIFCWLTCCSGNRFPHRTVSRSSYWDYCLIGTFLVLSMCPNWAVSTVPPMINSTIKIVNHNIPPTSINTPVLWNGNHFSFNPCTNNTLNFTWHNVNYTNQE